MISSPNVSKMYFDLYLHTNVLIDGSVSNSARQGKAFDRLFHLFCPFVNLYVMSYIYIYIWHSFYLQWHVSLTFFNYSCIILV